MKRHLLLSIGTILLLSRPGVALEQANIPDREPDDAIMAEPTEVQRVAAWAQAAFRGEPAGEAEKEVRLDVLRQDHSVLHYGQSCIGTPLRIGKQGYEHGLGTHANSEIRVHVPATARRFQAWAGIDNNYDTGGVHGSVQFSVEIAGREVFRSPTVKGGQEPLRVDLELPAGTREFLLKVDTTPDGAGWDQSDWADAKIALEDGTALRLDDAKPVFMQPGLPFSFKYGDAASADLLKSWKRTAESKDAPDRACQRTTWTDPQSGLAVTAEVSVFKRYPAVDWVLYFENTGTKDTPIIEDIRALDVVLRTGNARQPAVLHQVIGDTCDERSFLPFDTVLQPDHPITCAPEGGRSSNGTFPFFDVQYANDGLITAVGWSGQWSASLARSQVGPTRLQAGMERTHLLLHPGERIRTPRILLMPWSGDRVAAHQRWRRLLMFHYVPKTDGRPLQLPIAGQCFDRYVRARPKWGSVADQVMAAEAAAKAGCDYHWLDAAWFDTGFPNGVGNWFPRKDGFPDGMRPVADAVHKLGMKFIVWFEPERVAAGSQLAKEHPEFVFGGKEDGLYKLGDAKALRFMTNLLCKDIDDFGLDVYRNDFNIDPLPFWQANDTPDRVGMTQIRYIEGLYAMWDELIAKHPGLWIDNCASGGRRIDLEMCMRSVPLWHSDTCCSPGHAEWNQTHLAGLSLYLPLFTACAWTPAAYDARSAVTGGLICQFAILDDNFPFDQAQAATAEARAIQPFWYGDYYPLTPVTTTNTDGWIAYQLHRGDLDAGVVLAFRRSTSNYSAMSVNLAAVRPEGTYKVEFSDDSRKSTQRTMTGRELANELELRIAKKPGSLLLHYSRADR
jgi:alpha-galactosidase